VADHDDVALELGGEAAATGKTAAQVAATLSLSEATIIYHLTKARRKLDAENSRHAISKAISLKLIAPN
jgi:DNA-binding CsgD family transcriptional regulator